jgi:hypothetical protein
MSDYINKTFGPFGFNKDIGLMIIQSDSMVLLKFDLWTFFKYVISQQVPFVFSNTIDKLIESPINELINRFDNTMIKFEQIKSMTIKKSGWLNSIVLTTKNDQIKLGILERYKTDSYQKMVDWINSEIIKNE